MTTIKNLTADSLLQIFSIYIESEGHIAFSKNIPRVCKSWNALSKESILWKDIRTLPCPIEEIEYRERENWEYLLLFSRRGLLNKTQSLTFECQERRFFHTNLSALLENIEDLKVLDLKKNAADRDTIKVVTEKCPNLEILISETANFDMIQDLSRLLTVCGPTLKYLDLSYIYGSRNEQKQLASAIAVNCPILESLHFYYGHSFPIHELRTGCPKLKELLLFTCRFITFDGNDSVLGCGFKNLQKFVAVYCDFGGWDVYSLLKDSSDLELLILELNNNIVISNISNIPSNKVWKMNINFIDPDKDFDVIKDILWKWRHSLSEVHLYGYKYDMSTLKNS